MHIGAAQLLGADHLAGRRLHQRRAAQENRALLVDDDGFIAHGRHIGAARRARAHDHGDLRNARRRHGGLVEEDAAEMIAVGKDFVLVRQIGAAANPPDRCRADDFRAAISCARRCFFTVSG